MEARQQPAMLRSIVRLLALTGLGTFIILISLPLAVRFRFAGATLSLNERLSAGGFGSPEFIIKSILLAGAAVIGAVVLFFVLKHLESSLQGVTAAQASFLDTLDLKYVDLAIIFSAALSLFLEL